MTLETWFKNLELFKPVWNVCKTIENKFTFSYILNERKKIFTETKEWAIVYQFLFVLALGLSLKDLYFWFLLMKDAC